MISLTVDAVLLAALVVTSLTMIRVQRRLKRLDVEHGTLRELLEEMTDALQAADTAVAGMREEGCAILLALGQRIEEARSIAGELDRQCARRPAAVACEGGGRSRRLDTGLRG